MNNQAAQTMPTVPQAFFDEFGVNADDRVMDYGRACYEAGLILSRCRDEFVADLAALSQTAGVPDRKTLFEQAEVLAACYRLKDLIEGAGCERWQNANGFRLKDTQQWVEFYNVVNRMQRLEYPPAAAPAASGVHPDALPDGTLSKSTAKRVEALASASVGRMTMAEYTTGHCPNHNQPGGCQLLNLS